MTTNKSGNPKKQLQIGGLPSGQTWRAGKYTKVTSVIFLLKAAFRMCISQLATFDDTGGYIDFCWRVPSPPGSDTSGPPGHLSLEIQSISTRSPTSLCGAWWLVDFGFNSTVNYIYIYTYVYTHCVQILVMSGSRTKGNIRIGTNANFSFFNSLKPKVRSKF